MDAGPGLAHQVEAGWILGLVKKRTALYLLSKPGRLAGDPDQLLSLEQLP